MSDDLVKRLRVRAEFTGPYSVLWDEAADRIEKLEAALRRLIDYGMVSYQDLERARKALEGKDD
jgi:HAMP domain-containing protein